MQRLVPPSDPQQRPEAKPARRKAWPWIAAWTLGFLLLPGFFASLLYRRHAATLAQSLPRVADSPHRVAPDWVPVRNDFRIAGTSSEEGSGSASLLAGEAIEDVAAYYESSLRRAGFRVSTRIREQDDLIRGAFINAINETGHVVTVTLSRIERGTRIELDFSANR